MSPWMRNGPCRDSTPPWMFGSISYYGKEDGNPKRLQSRYTARMPEQKFLTFRSQFKTAPIIICNFDTKKILTLKLILIIINL
jgi:hypothetical protein